MLLVRRCNIKNCFVRNLSSKKTSHYEILGVKSSATQAEIKTAYYELSKLYHPDTNQGNQDFLNKFRNVNSAYEVLGNVKSRRLYDRGLIVGESSTVLREDVEDDPTARFYQKREKRAHVPSPVDGKTVYDFDAWTKAHYSKSKERREKEKAIYEYRMSQRKEGLRARSSGKTSSALVGVLILALFLSNVLIADDFDRVRIAKDSKTKDDT